MGVDCTSQFMYQHKLPCIFMDSGIDLRLIVRVDCSLYYSYVSLGVECTHYVDRQYSQWGRLVFNSKG